jgi:hypothetical protein
MNIDEREQLARFLDQLAKAQAVPKDGEADTLIRAACARQADAAYLLVQRAMLLEHALQNSQSEITRLQDQLDQARNQSLAANQSASFLDANAWGNSPATRPAPALAQQTAPLAAAPAAPGAAQAASAWGSGMLGSIAGTAAGVVAGGFIFRGIEQLIGNRGASPGTINGLGNQAAIQDNSTATNKAAPDDSAGSGDIFDTTSVDDYIAGDSDSGA